MAVTGEPGAHDPTVTGFADVFTAVHATVSVLAALQGRQQSRYGHLRRPEHVRLGGILLERELMLWDFTARPAQAGWIGNRHSGALEAEDGYVALILPTHEMWRRLCGNRRRDLLDASAAGSPSFTGPRTCIGDPPRGRTVDTVPHPPRDRRALRRHMGFPPEKPRPSTSSTSANTSMRVTCSSTIDDPHAGRRRMIRTPILTDPTRGRAPIPHPNSVTQRGTAYRGGNDHADAPTPATVRQFGISRHPHRRRRLRSRDGGVIDQSVTTPSDSIGMNFCSRHEPRMDLRPRSPRISLKVDHSHARGPLFDDSSGRTIVVGHPAPPQPWKDGVPWSRTRSCLPTAGCRPTGSWRRSCGPTSRLVSTRWGGKMPTESALQSEHNVSRHTVREALQVLLSDGLITAVQGSGTYVSGRQQDTRGRYVRSIGSLDEIIVWPDTNTEVIEPFSVAVEPSIAARLELPYIEVSTATVRRSHDGIPFVLTRHYVEPELGAKLAAEGVPRSAREP